MNKNRYTRRIMAAALAIAAALVLLVSSIAAETQPTKLTAEDSYRAASECVLYVRSYSEAGKLVTTGSGFVVTEDGVAVTAAHVIKKAARITVLLTDGKELEATLLSSDTDTDVAVLRLPKGTYKHLTVTSTAPKSGAVLRALGYPMKDNMMITEGICSSPSGTISGKQKMFVTCQIASGMSGGPVLNEYGQVVGAVSGTVITMSGVNVTTLTEALYNAVKPYLPTA